jgi:hypothetical protein
MVTAIVKFQTAPIIGKCVTMASMTQTACVFDVNP